MQNAEDAGSAEIWRAAQNRRAEDLSNWLGTSAKRSQKSPAIRVVRSPLNRSFALTRRLTIAITAFVALASVSAVVHAGKTSHVVLRATGPMPAVNVP
jgi:hypothetical protein